MKNQTTKERILAAAEELMLEQSFHAVGLKQILDAVRVPKGSFYHYFESKEQFGVEMLRHYMAEASAWKRSLLLPEGTDTSPTRRLFDYLDTTVDIIGAAPGRFPCLALKLAAEVSDLSEGMRAEIARGFKDWIGIYQAVLDEAAAKKELPEDFDTRSAAQLVSDVWSGATYRAVANQDVEPVRHAVRYIKSRIGSLHV